MKDIFSIRTNPQAKDRMKEAAKYIGGELGTDLSAGQALEIMANKIVKEYESKYWDSQFYGKHLDGGWVMTAEGLQRFVDGVDRAEVWMTEEPGTYLKALRVALHTLGFDPDWVEEDLWQALSKKYLKGRSDITVSIGKRKLTDAEHDMWWQLGVLPVEETMDEINENLCGARIVYAGINLYGEKPEIEEISEGLLRKLDPDPHRTMAFSELGKNIDVKGFPFLDRNIIRILDRRMEELGWH